MAGWKLRKDKIPTDTPDAETLDAAEAPDADVPAEAVVAVPDTDFEAAVPAQTYDLGDLGNAAEPASLDSLRHFSSFGSEPEAGFTDLDFDSDAEDNFSKPGDGPLTLVDYTESEAAPAGFILQGAQIFAMPPPEIEAPGVIEMPLPAVEAPPPIIEAPPLMQAEEAPEMDFSERLRTGRFDRSELASLAPAPSLGIPMVAPFVLDTPVSAAPPAAAPQLVVRVGRLSAPFPLAKDVTMIGRPDSALHHYPDVEIELDDAVSRRHAEVVKRGDSYYLVDTGSTNGTLLNGEKLPPQEERLLAYGDRIRVGDRTEITFE